MKEFFLVILMSVFAPDTGVMHEDVKLAFGPYASKADCVAVIEETDVDTIQGNIDYYTGGLGTFTSIDGCYSEDELFEEQ